MKVLVTGASGFLGGHLVERLLRDGHEVRALVRNSSNLDLLATLARATADGGSPARISMHTGDLDDEASLAGIMDGIELVFHAGAGINGTWPELERTTVQGTGLLLQAALEAGIKRFVHVSSVVVYQVGALASNCALDETCPLELRPGLVGPYARSKVEAEKLVRAYQQRGLDTVIIRPGLVYGPRGRVFWPNIGVLRGRICLLPGKARDLLPLVHVDDVVQAMVLAAHTPAASGRAYHVADHHGMTKRGYIKRFNQATGVARHIVPVPVTWIGGPLSLAGSMLRLPGRLGLPPGRLGNKRLPTGYGLRSKFRGLRFDCTRARTELGWQPARPLEQGVEQHLAQSLMDTEPATGTDT